MGNAQGRVTESLQLAVVACRSERLPLDVAMRSFEWAYIDEAMTKTARGGHRNISAAARRLGIHRNTLYLKLQRERP